MSKHFIRYTPSLSFASVRFLLGHKIGRLSFQRSFAVLLGLFYPPCPPKGIFFLSPSFVSIKFCFLPQAFAAVSFCVVTNFLQWHTHKHTHIKKNISSNNPVTLNQEYATHPQPLKLCRLFSAHLSAWFVDPLGLARDRPERNACLFRGFRWDLPPPPPPPGICTTTFWNPLTREKHFSTQSFHHPSPRARVGF